MLKRLILTVLFATALIAWSIPTPEASAKELTIGSDAPPLDIEHWLQDGEGFFKPVKEFEDDKVYVIEFWATWCGPCIQNMPHIAELQEQYRGQNVQIIGVSDETEEEVTEFLDQEHPQLEKKMAEVTAAYSLTADPDRSAHEDYMEASNQQGIPTAFIVGKDGKIEWIGHPAAMDPVLEKVVKDSWDREAFKEEQRMEQELQENLHKVDELVSNDKVDEALELIEQQLKTATKEAMKKQWYSIKCDIKLHFDRVDDEVIQHYKDHLASFQGSPRGVAQFAYWMFGASQQGADISKVVRPVLLGLKEELKEASEEEQPLLYNAAAVLTSTTGDLDLAVKLQQRAIESSPDPRQKKRMMPLLEELKEKAAEKSKEKKAAKE
jgi:thiol-disulfide isomerase/thioredoxin